MIPVVILGIGAAYDLQSSRIPDILSSVLSLLYMAAALWYFGLALQDVLVRIIYAFSIAACLMAVTLLSEKIFSKKLMGGGDIKLLFSACLYFGFWEDMLGVFISCTIALAAFILEKDRKNIPLAPAFFGGFFLVIILRPITKLV